MACPQGEMQKKCNRGNFNPISKKGKERGNKNASSLYQSKICLFLIYMKKIFLAFMLVASIVVNSQSWQDTIQSIDKILNRYASTDPGAQMAISRNGQVIYFSAKGMADLEHNAPLTKTSRIEAGSVSKQFTAAAILLLEQQGKLSLNDDIRKYVPEIRDYGNVITIQHLMHHTSGLKDWGSIAEIAGWPRGTKAYSNEDALYFISLQTTLNNKPGDEYIYSNSNYTLMTIIVQRVSGMSHATFTKKQIFEPAGMKNTEWRDNYKRVVPGRAIAYSKSNGVYVTNMPNEDTYGHGGLLTTAEDLLIWNNFYLSGKLGSPSLFPDQKKTIPLNNGKHNSYAAALNLAPINGWDAISHTGATASYRANLEYFPEQGLSFAWLSNNSEPELSTISGEIRNLFITDKRTEERNAAATDHQPAGWKTFIPYLGAYKESRTGAGLSLYQKENGIYSLTNGGPLEPINETTLAAGRGRMIFKSTRPRMLNFITASGDTLYYSGTDSAKTDGQSLKEYAGKYYSAETESALYAEVIDGKLMLGRPAKIENIISPVYKDGFNFPGGDIYFERNKKGRITHFFISISRARKVKFKKIVQE